MSPSCLKATCAGKPSQSSWAFVPMNHALSPLSLYSLYVYFCCVTLTSPAALSPVWVLTSLHAPAACDQAWLSARPPSRGPWGAPPPRWPPRPSRTTASPGGRPTRAPRQRPAGVGAALGGLSGVVPWSPGSTSPYAPGPEGKKDGGPPWVGVLLFQGALSLAEGLTEKWGPYFLGSSGHPLAPSDTRPEGPWDCSMLGREGLEGQPSSPSWTV